MIIGGAGTFWIIPIEKKFDLLEDTKGVGRVRLG